MKKYSSLINTDSMKTVIIKFFFILILVSGYGIQAQQFTSYTTADGLPSNFVNGIAIDSFNHKWFGTQAGVAMFNDTIWEVYTTTDGLIDNYITCIAVDINDVVWAGTEMGINKFDGAAWTSLTTANGLVNNTITYIAADPDGSIWIGTTGGVSHISGQIITNYTTAEGLPNDMISYIAPDAYGQTWFGTWLGGLSMLDQTGFTNYTTADSLPENNIIAIAIGMENTKWIGTSLSGAAVFDSLNQWNFTYRTSDGLLNNSIQDIAMDSKGGMWFGIYDSYTQDGGLSRYTSSVWKSYTVADGLIDALVKRIAVDKDDNIWIATGNGVSKLKDENAGISEINGINLRLYPNPVCGKLHIDGLSLPGTLKIFSITGKEMLSYKLSSGSNTIMLPALQPGLSIIRIQTANDVFSGKLIIQ